MPSSPSQPYMADRVARNTEKPTQKYTFTDTAEKDMHAHAHTHKGNVQTCSQEEEAQRKQQCLKM